MAEGWGRALKGQKYDFYSAGLETHGLNPNAVKVMGEAAVDISGHTSKTPADIDAEMDIVITVCGHADETCPIFPGAPKIVHVGFDDPPKLAKEAKTEDEALGHYRRVRDEIRNAIANIEDVI